MELFYYIRDDLKRPVITVCLKKEDDRLARGIAICSVLDVPNKKIGRAIASGRATKALKHNDIGNPIASDKALGSLYEQIGIGCYDFIKEFPYKSELIDTTDLSYFETELLGKIK